MIRLVVIVLCMVLLTGAQKPSFRGAGWHPPTDHEHGDEPPQWVTQFSKKEFHHGVIYGGNESTGDMERLHKHNVYKGQIVRSEAGGEGYLRYHAGSNPLDRASRYHSFELYYRDTANNISFVEGWYDTGDPNSTQQRCLALREFESRCIRPNIVVVDQYAWDQGFQPEQWYPSYPGIEFIIYPSPTTTFYSGVQENSTAHDLSTWKRTGALGLDRLAGFSIDSRIGQSGCVTPLGQPSNSCELRKIVSPTLLNDMRDGAIRASSSKTFVCSNCVLPN